MKGRHYLHNIIQMLQSVQWAPLLMVWFPSSGHIECECEGQPGWQGVLQLLGTQSEYCYAITQCCKLWLDLIHLFAIIMPFVPYLLRDIMRNSHHPRFSPYFSQALMKPDHINVQILQQKCFTHHVSRLTKVS